MWHNLISMRRMLILVIASSLVAAGSLSIFACMSMSFQEAACAVSTSPVCCDGMNTGKDDSRLVSSPDQACCLVSQARVPDYQFNIPDSSLTMPAAMIVGDFTIGTSSSQPSPIRTSVRDSAPPPFQPLLCTFLI